MRNSMLALLSLVAVGATLNTAEACGHKSWRTRQCAPVRTQCYQAPVSYDTCGSSYISGYVPGPNVIRAVDVSTGRVIFDRSQGIRPQQQIRPQVRPQIRPQSQQVPVAPPVSVPQPQIAPPPVEPPPPAPSELYSTPRPANEQLYQAPKPQ